MTSSTSTWFDGEALSATKYGWEGYRKFPHLHSLGRIDVREWARASQRAVPIGSSQVYFESDPDLSVSREVQNSFAFFVRHEELICRAAVDAAFTHYGAITEWLDEWIDSTIRAQAAPQCQSISDFVALIALECLHVHPADDLGADVGLEFACSWEEEHGLGVRVRGDRVVCVSGATHAFEHWEWVRHSIDTLGDGLSKGTRIDG